MTGYRVASQSLIQLPRPIHNRAYRKFVSGLPCSSCGQNWWVDPHHIGPRGCGQKASDLDTVPLCRKCHDLCHDLGPSKFQILKALDFGKIVADLQALALAQGLDLSVDNTAKKRPGRVAGFKSRRGAA